MADDAFFNGHGSLREMLAELPFPVDFFNPGDALPAFLDNVFVLNAGIKDDHQGTLAFDLSLVFAGELSFTIPGFDGVKLVIGGSLPDLSGIVDTPEPDMDADPTPEGFPTDVDPLPNLEGMTFLTVELGISPIPQLIVKDLTVALRFDPSVLQPAQDGEGPVEISTQGTVTIDRSFNVQVSGFSAFNLSPAIIGSSGIAISANDVELDLSRTDSPPNILSAGFDEAFLGVFVGGATLTLPAGMLGSGTETVTLTNAAIGSGGVSGTAALAHLDPTFDSTTNTYTGARAGSLFGVPFWLSELDLTLKANAFVEAKITGEIFMPFFEQRVQVQIGFDGKGGLLVQVAGTGSGGLLTFTVVTGVQFQILALSLQEQGGKALFKLNTKLLLSGVGGLASWPSPEVDGLTIDSDGQIKIEGGWIDLPKQASLDLDGFTMELTKIGFGAEDSGDRWIGFSGALKLVDGIKAGASVKGLRILLTEPPSISLDGVGIDFEIPGTLAVTGSVSRTGSDFAGAVKVVVTPISLTVDGQFLTGRNVTTGKRYFAIFLHGELPVGIPLGATGLAIYGLAGLYGQGVAPGKKPTEDWYENPDATPGWYKRAPVGIDSLADKWTPTDGAYAFGAGVTLGTYSDNGYEFSGSLLLALTFPGPTILIDGRANLFKKRAELSGSDPTFRALAVIQPGKSFLLGLDAHYRYKSGGELLDVKGSAEAFFDFTNATNWHIFIGRKDPKLKHRIAARLFTLFDVTGYFELTPAMLQIGAGWSFDKKYGFDSLNVHVQASMQTDATVSWHPNHFTGGLILDGSAGLSAFGHGVGVHAHADVTGDVFEPFHLHGKFSVGIDLPWPLPDLGGTITLDWQQPLSSTPALPLPLREATVEHNKRMLKWPIPRNGIDGALLPDNNGSGDLELPGSPPPAMAPDSRAPVPAPAPRVPADSAIGLAFSRPVEDPANVGVNGTGAAKETIGDPTSDPKKPVGAYTVEYQLSSLALEKRVPAPESVTDLNDLGPRWVQVAQAHGALDQPGQQQLFGAWAPSPPDASSPTANSQQLKLLVNAKTPFDYTAQQLQTWDNWFESANASYPCQPPPLDPNQQFCATFVGVQFLPSEGNEIDFDDPPFSVIWPESAELVDSDQEVPGGGGSHRSLGVVATHAPDDELLVVPPTGTNQVLIRVGTVQAIPTLVPTNVNQGEIQVNTVTLGTAILSVFSTLNPTDDLTPGPGPDKTPSAAIINSDGSLQAGDVTEITLPAPAVSALNVDLDLEVSFGPDSRGNPELSDLVVFTDAGERQVINLDLGRQSFRLRTSARIIRVNVELGGSRLANIFRVHARTPVSALAVSREGSDEFGPYEEVDGVITVLGDDIGVAKLGTPTPCEFTLMELCTPDRRVELNRHTLSSLDLLAEEDAIFDPQADYRMVVTTRRSDHAVASNADAASISADIKLVEQAYFHVVAPPGIEVPDKPATPPPSAGEGNTTGFEDLRFYVKSTVPDSAPASDGKPVVPRAFYRAYDVSIAFNEPSSVEKMYRLARRDLTLRLFDTSNSPVLDASGRAIVPTTRWDTATQPTLTDAEQRWVRMVNAATCRPNDIPTFNITDAKTDQLVSGPAEQLLLPVTLYQARLVPALLHEAFVNAIAGLAADGSHELERWFAINSVAAAPGRWVVDSANVIGPDGNPVTDANGKPVKTFFATETTGNSSTLVYRGPIAAPEDSNAPDQWTDFRASIQLRWSAGSVAFQFRRASTGDQLSISLDRVSGARLVVAVINGTQNVLSTDQPDFGGAETDSQLAVECVGNRLHVMQTGAADLDLTLPAGAATTGTLGFLASGAAGCRFGEIRVDDLRPDPATAQRFDFITSRYATFAHHVASFDDQILEVAAALGLTAADLTTSLPASISIPAGGPLASGLTPVNEAESRAFDALELKTLGEDGRLRSPSGIEIFRASHDPTVTALLVRSPEPLLWERTRPVVSVPAAESKLGPPGDVKVVTVSFGATPPDERVTLVVRAGRTLTGFALQWRHIADATDSNPAWSPYYTFGTETTFGEGTDVVVSSGSSANAPVPEPGTVQRFVAADAASAVLHFPTDGTGVELRLLDAAGSILHQREFRPDAGFSQVETNLIRKLDGTAFFSFQAPSANAVPPVALRLTMTLTRNLGAQSTEPILRQAGSETAEVAILDVALVKPTP